MSTGACGSSRVRPFQAVHVAAVPSFTCCLSWLVHYFIPNIRECKAIHISRSPQTAPVLSLSVKIQQNAGEIPELMEDLSAASSEVLGLANLKGICSSSAGKLQEANFDEGGHLVRKEKASLCLPLAGSRFAACKQTWAHSVSPWAHSVSPLPQKILQEGCCSSCFQSSVAALTYQAQKRPEFVFCFQQESSHSSCYPS